MIAAEEICRLANYETKWIDNESSVRQLADTQQFALAIPNGRYTRWNHIDYQTAEKIKLNGIPPALALGDYIAVLYKDTGEIEAAVRSLIDPPTTANTLTSWFGKLPGFLIDGIEQVIPNEMEAFHRRIAAAKWMFPLHADSRQKWSVEISRSSPRFIPFRAFAINRDVTLKVKGATVAHHHDQAVELLEEVSRAVLFEIDLRYGLALSLSPLFYIDRARRTTADGKQEPRQHRRREVSKDKPSLPKNGYPAKPLALYWYARSASNMPLLQYLAYYQVLEYHFTSYYRRETLDRLRHELLDPRFSPQNDTHLNRLVNIATSDGKGFGTERDQLRATVRACIPASSLEEYLDDPDRRDFFTGRQPINSLPRLDFSPKGADLRDQTSDRIYEIRCRIVHTKSESRDQHPELILPFSKEADSLGFDIDLAQYLAQRILINQAYPLQIQ
jgi:hypothetical protein